MRDFEMRSPVEMEGSSHPSVSSVRFRRPLIAATTDPRTAAVGASFAFTESVVANQRQTDDAISAASGGISSRVYSFQANPPVPGACAAGFLLGISGRRRNLLIIPLLIHGLAARSLPMAVGACSVMAGFTGLHKYNGGMQQHQPDPAAEKKSFFKPTAIVEATKRE